MTNNVCYFIQIQSHQHFFTHTQLEIENNRNPITICRLVVYKNIHIAVNAIQSNFTVYQYIYILFDSMQLHTIKTKTTQKTKIAINQSDSVNPSSGPKLQT